MGHERMGVLPRTKHWTDIVNQIGSFSSERKDISSVARGTLKNVRDRFDTIEKDQGVYYSFEFLLLLSHSFQKNDPIGFLIDKKVLPDRLLSPLKIARALKQYVSPHIDSSEYGSISKSSAIDALNFWLQENTVGELKLFDDETPYADLLKKLSDGSGFCEISRLFFAKFTERYLKYFLEREASSQITSIQDREKFNAEIEKHISKISKHAFETSKITQSFSAGWFNKYAKEKFPNKKLIESYLNYAFGKMKGELLREEHSDD